MICIRNLLILTAGIAATAYGARADAQQMPADLLNPPGADVFVLPPPESLRAA